jgi:hypothetical protein
VTGAAPGEGWEPYAEGVWRLVTYGEYLTCNDRADLEIGPRAGVRAPRPRPDGLATPTTPCYADVSFSVVEPAGLERRWDTPERLEFFWHGRLVHRAQEEYDAFLGRRQWEHRSADDWDNCADERFLATAV